MINQLYLCFAYPCSRQIGKIVRLDKKQKIKDEKTIMKKIEEFEMK